MRNQNEDREDDYDYSPNELAHLSIRNPEKYREIVSSNLSDGDSIEKWQSRNMESARDFLEHQRRNRK